MNVEKIFPQEFINNITNSGQALINKLQTEQDIIESDILNVDHLTSPYRCPTKYLSTLAYEKAVKLKDVDSERVKRDKIYNANNSHLVRGLFYGNLKERLDYITGGDAQFFERLGNEFTEDSIFTDNSEIRLNTWSMFGCVFTVPQTEPQGKLFVGSGDESFIAGNFYIDLGVAGLSGDVINSCIDEVNINGGFAYFRIFLGYVDGSGLFVQYGSTIE